MDSSIEAAIEKTVDDTFAKEFGIVDEIMTARTLPGGQTQINIYHRKEGEKGYIHYQGGENYIRNHFYSSINTLMTAINVGIGAITGGATAAFSNKIFKWSALKTWQTGLIGAAAGGIAGGVIGSIIGKGEIDNGYNELIADAKNTEPPAISQISNKEPLPLSALEGAKQRQSHAVHLINQRISESPQQKQI